MLLKENIMSFLAQCLMDPEVPITTNIISFLLDIAAKLEMNQTGRAQVSTLVYAFTHKVCNKTRISSKIEIIILC